MFIPLKDENPTLRFPVITIILIAVNCLVFLYQVFSPNGLEYHVLKFGIIPYEITHWEAAAAVPRVFWPLSLITGMFLHGSLLHLLGNMLYLWIFGNNVEDFLGPVKFVLFYLACGVTASLLQVAVYPNSRVPMIGASGAIAGLLGAYLVLFPSARVKTLVFLIFYITIIYVPAWVLLGLWFFLQVSNIGLGGGVAWFAHIGGFLAGLSMVLPAARRRRKFYYV
ncbi:MAG: rhomboid family serine protease [Candidatus Saccharicenans subterraneus]|uniref:Rhomboid family serine protease n=1 Tax=Candidatus Saccharicenans subterraneus TaxID=2508984 RepID=A0A3E2BQX1_9BACT|nr:MAG: rhomboid family serine protease [Candidatus Saccharicenans subterraneum]